MSDWAWTQNEHGETPVHDINDVVLRMESYVTRRGGFLGLSLRHIRDQIIRYVRWRLRHAWVEVSPPQHLQTIPTAWTTHAERVWTDWLSATFRYEDWVAEVIAPVFGTDERFWEARCSTQWRREVFGWLPFWIEREWDIVDEFDPVQTDERTTSAWETDNADGDVRSHKR